MKKTEMLTEITSWLDQMKFCREHHNLQLTELPEDIEYITYDIIKDGHSWLKKLISNEFAEWQSVRGLLSDSLWERYESWGMCEDTREWGMMQNILKDLRAKIKARPPLFKKGFIRGQIKAAKELDGASNSPTTSE
jgi:hypothetical protein